MLPYLARLLALKLAPGTRSAAHAPPEELADEIRRAYRTWIASLAGRDPSSSRSRTSIWPIPRPASSPKACSSSPTGRRC